MKKFFRTLGVILICLLVFAVIIALGVAKVEAYGGDASCLFIHCVKVIR